MLPGIKTPYKAIVLCGIGVHIDKQTNGIEQRPEATDTHTSLAKDKGDYVVR